MGTQLLFRGFPKLSFKSNDIRLILLPKAFAFLDRFPETQLDDDQPRLPKRAHKQLLFVLSHSFKILLHVDASQLPALPLINRLVQVLTLNRELLCIGTVKFDGEETVTGQLCTPNVILTFDDDDHP
ncbi:hypothetical protein FRB91_011524 [Serendipita sp. 411]|nr:hypothetical protein FRB91_011524 [Serendipita sp. 411]